MGTVFEDLTINATPSVRVPPPCTQAHPNRVIIYQTLFGVCVLSGE